MLFSEIYGSYYHVVSEILTKAVEGNLSKQEMNRIIKEKAFGESIVAIPEALQENRWFLLNEQYHTPLQHRPSMPPTNLQRMWLKAILNDPRIQLFEPKIEGLDDVEPLYDQNTFVYYDRVLDGDPYEDIAYSEHFRLILIALRTHVKIRITYQSKNGTRKLSLIPQKLEYSSKDDKFRLIAVNESQYPYILNLGKIMECGLLEPFEPANYLPATFDTKDVVLILTDERMALERAMLSFSDLEKETIKEDDLHYRIKLTYKTVDETEILIRILAFGPMLKVVEPQSFIELIKERLQMQKKLLH